MGKEQYNHSLSLFMIVSSKMIPSPSSKDVPLYILLLDKNEADSHLVAGSKRQVVLNLG
jgi:hypothetical protein